MVEDDLDEALLPWGSPVKAAQEVLRILRDDIRSIIEFGGLSLESYVDFKHNVKGRINRLEAGPPLVRSQQLLALMDAGGGRAAVRSRPRAAHRSERPGGDFLDAAGHPAHGNRVVRDQRTPRYAVAGQQRVTVAGPAVRARAG